MEQAKIILNFRDYNKQVEVNYTATYKELLDIAKSYLNGIACQMMYEKNGLEIDIMNDACYQKAIQAFPNNLTIIVCDLSSIIDVNRFIDPRQQNAIQNRNINLQQNQNQLPQQNPYKTEETKKSQDQNLPTTSPQKVQIKEEAKIPQNFYQPPVQLQANSQDLIISSFRQKIREELYSLTNNQVFISNLAQVLSKQLQLKQQPEVINFQNSRQTKSQNVGQFLEVIEIPSFILPGSLFNLTLKIKNTGLNSWKQGKAIIKCEQIPQLNYMIEQEVNPEQTIEKQYKGITSPQIQPQNQAQQDIQIAIKFTLEIENKEVSQFIKKINLYFPQFQILTPQILLNQGQAVMEFQNLNSFD